ncbi:MAG: prolyl-tRNA synthetase [Candidatus Nomurabacteria bacterium]|jgi:prolyl-tRNA synthetase|nr:prolyl-tRNA synthetase [Candidatus Nomurabacteria bacterium]
MKRSELFTKTFKNVSGEETSRNAQLLLRAGYIHKELAGVYTYLPLGLKVLENIKKIIREEMNAVGGQEALMTTLQNKELWETTNRWDSKKMDIWFKTDLAAGGQLGLAPTHEEPITAMMTQHIASYKDLPRYVYQFQTKFRNELRAKSGVMRTREFLMKDMYSFSKDKAQHEEFYEKTIKAYHKVYERLGIGDITYKTFASGGVFSKYSHEFQTICPAGEDVVYMNKDHSLVFNEEVFTDDILAEFGAKKTDFAPEKAAEVGNIFSLGFKYAEPLGLEYSTKEDAKKTVYMGCYGIGVSRLMGVMVEIFADEKGLVWADNVAPFQVYLVGIGDVDKEVVELYDELTKKGVEVLFDDRADARTGEKMADADLLGVPYRVVVSEKSLAEGKVELKKRTGSTPQLLTKSQLFDKMKVRC